MRSREAALAEAIDATLDRRQRALLLEACALIDGIADTLGGGGKAAKP